MISLADIYHVLVATVPLYVAMALAYICIRWCKLFSPDQCSGINKFVAKISIPLLSFHVISTSNPYQMNLKLIFSDTLQKLMAIIVFSILDRVCFGGNLDWLIMGLSVSTLPNTLIMGIPLLKAMYGDEAAKLLGQIVVLQSLIWYTLLLFLFEFRAARAITARTIKKTGENIDFAVHVEVEPEALQEIHSIPEGEEAQAPTRKISIQVIMVMVGRKLMENPNTYACIAGLTWGLISFRYGLELPPIVGNSISILSDGGLGMAMFSLGLFTASQSSIIACGTRILVLSMGLRFFIGPVLMAIPSYALGMRGTLLRVAIVQAALPQGIVPFVFAKEYDVHPDILSTGVILGMIVAIPITLAYYSLLYL